MNIAIVKYNAGNIRSVELALKRIGHEAVVTADPATLRAADKVIFPGVGAANAAMPWLEAAGLVPVLRELKQPVLGICLGMQLLAEASEEGPTACLYLVPSQVKRFLPSVGKVPQIGWNLVSHQGHPLFEGLPQQVWMYHVHGFYLPLGAHTIARTTYGLPYTAALQHQNFYAVQFHPERSGPAGSRLLQNFLAL